MLASVQLKAAPRAKRCADCMGKFSIREIMEQITPSY